LLDEAAPDYNTREPGFSPVIWEMSGEGGQPIWNRLARLVIGDDRRVPHHSVADPRAECR